MGTSRLTLGIAFALGVLFAACGGSEFSGDAPGAGSAGTGGTAGSGGGSTAGSGGGSTAGSGGGSTAGSGGGEIDGGTAGAPADSGVGDVAQGQPGIDIVAAGEVLRSPSYTLVLTVGQGPGGNTTYTSPNYTLGAGLVPATQP